MYLIVIGAETEGRRFINLAAENDHKVTLIEKDEEKARQVLKETNIRVLNADITDDEILQEAEIDRADAVIATTYDDAKNLMAMILAKEHGVEIRISLVNQRSHTQVFETLEVKTISDPASIIAQQLYQHLP